MHKKDPSRDGRGYRLSRGRIGNPMRRGGRGYGMVIEDVYLVLDAIPLPRLA